MNSWSNWRVGTSADKPEAKSFAFRHVTLVFAQLKVWMSRIYHQYGTHTVQKVFFACHANGSEKQWQLESEQQL
jgi:hypothetical protein